MAISINAQPPLQTNVDAQVESLQIIYPQASYFTANKNLTFRFLVLNSSSFLLDNSTTNCSFSYQTSNNTYFFNLNTTYDPSDQNFLSVIDQSDLDKGELTYFIYCQNDHEAGFVSNKAHIGSPIFEEDPRFLIAFIVGVCLVAGILVYIGNSVDESHYILKLGLLFFAFTLLLLVPSSLINGINRTSDNFFRAVIWVVRLFAVYIFLYFNYVLWLKNKFIQLDIIKQKPRGKDE